jgi:DNA polymerase-3 subunit gamma/tau
VRASSEVLARKYRPSNFDELIGQETIAQTLSLSLDTNRLSHAYLFSGLRGSGKTSTARIFAKALLCEEGMRHNPCGVCSNCVMAIENRHMDIIEMDGASNRGIDDIRDLVEQTKYKPAAARFKIFIIDEVHMLTAPAFNALLKTLEEPPEYVKFILATTDPLKLPATILSRTQHFRFKSIATTKIIEHLAYILNRESVSYERDALEILARSGNGSLRDTLTLLDQAIIYSKNHVDVTTVTDMLGLVDPQFISDIFTAIFTKDFEKITHFCKALEEYEAEMVVDELIAYLKEKLYANDPHFSTLILDRFFRILSDAKYLFSINADGTFVLSMIFFKMVEALKIKEIDQMIESLQNELDSKPNIKSISIPYSDETPTVDTQKTAKPVETEVPKIQIHQETPTPAVQPTPQKDKKFIELIEMIKDRSAELGEMFASSIHFVSYEENVLTWESCVSEEEKKALTHGYSAIKQLVREVYGFNTKIKSTPCTKILTPKIEEKKTLTPNAEKLTMPEPQPTSMIEDAEIGGSGSCITGCSEEEKQPPKEINGADILDEPLVQKATELFEATKRTIQNKM